MSTGPVQRRSPRFPTARKVELRADTRGSEFGLLWARNVSSDGLFVETLSPPPVGTEVELWLETDEGAMAVTARVAHIVDAAAASRIGHPPGAGLELVDVPESARSLMERYVVGATSDLERVLRPPALDMTRQILTRVGDSDLYAALDVDPLSTTDVIEKRIAAIRSVLADAPAELSTEQANYVRQALGVIDRAGSVLLDETSRLDYDFRRGHVHAEVRIHAARGDATKVERMRRAWANCFPVRVERAKRHSRQALWYESQEDFGEAYREGLLSLEEDPFNVALRESVAAWKMKIA